MNRGTNPSRSGSPQPFTARPKRRLVPPVAEALEARTLLSRLTASVASQAIRPGVGAGNSVMLITVPGQAGELVPVTFHLDDHQTSFRNEMGIYPVANGNGRVGRFLPGMPGYLRAALSRPGSQVIFRQDEPKGSSVTVMLPGGSVYGLYLVANGTTQQALFSNPRHRPRAYISLARGNADHFAHVRAEAGTTFAWEDLPRGGDKDFNDLVTRVTFGNDGSGDGGGNPGSGGNGGGSGSSSDGNGGGNNGGGDNGGDHGGGGSTSSAPVITLDDTSGQVSRTNVQFTGRVTDADGDLARLQYRIDGGSLIDLAFDAATGAFVYPTAFALDGSADGRHVLQFVATDRAGHSSNVATANFLLDTRPPAITFDLAPESDTDVVGDLTTDLASVNLLGHTEGGLSVTLVETGAVVTADASGNFRFDGVPLPLGARTFHVRATDQAGNVGTSTQTLIHCGFADDLSGWNVTEDGGTEEDKGGVTPTEGHALLHEGDSFLVNLATGFTIPAGATQLRFDLESLNFDTTTTGAVRDAFEVALVDSQGRPIVPTIGTGRDAFYNQTEGLEAALGSGTTVSGSMVSVDLTGVAAGTTARLVFRLVNNDDDTETRAEVGCVVVDAGEASFVPGTPDAPGFTTTFASTGSGGVSNLSALTSGATSATDTPQFQTTDSQPASTTSSNTSQAQANANPDTNPSPNSEATSTATTFVSPAAVTDSGPTSAGREFWIAFSDNLVEGGRVPVKTLFISGDVATQGTVSIPGLGFTKDFTVTPGQITSIPLPDEVQVDTLAEIENKGVHIVADDPITVYGLNTAQATTDAFLALPIDSLGTRYVNMAYGTTTHLLSYLPTSQITIVGAHDGTNVTITPGPGVVPINNSNVSIIGPDGTVRGSSGDDGDIGPIFLNQSGTFTLKVASQFPTHAGTYSYRLLDLDADSATLPLNQSTTVSLPTGQETRVYKFQGTVGRQIILNGLDQNGQNVSARLVTPSLVVALQQGDDNTSGIYTLPETGTYYVIVSGRSDTPLDTAFRVVDVTGAPALGVGATASGTLATGREVAAYRFNGTAGRTLAFDALSALNGNVGCQVIGPDGEVVANTSFATDSAPFTLPLTGEYKVIVTGRTAAAYPYSFRLLDLDAAPGLTAGTTVSPSFPDGQESNWYNVTLTAGQWITYDTLGGGTPGSQARLFDPAGNALFTVNADRNSDPTFVSRSGTYRLQVQTTQGDPATIPFRLLDLGTATPLTFGVAATGKLATGRETLLYRFNADAGDPLFYDGLAGTFQSAIVSIYDPAGNRLTDVNPDGDRGPILAPTSGTYMVAVFGESDSPGEVHFRFLNLSTAPALTLGAATNATFATGGETLAYRFQGSAGQRLLYDPENTATNIGDFALLGPGQKLVSSGNALGNLGPILLDEDGTYTLLIRGTSNTAASFNFRLLDVAAAPALSTNSPNAGTLDPSSRSAVYQIDSPGGQTLTVNMTAISNPGGGTWSLIAPDGQAVISRNLDQNWSAPLARAGAYQLILSGNGSASAPLTYAFNATIVAQATVAPSGFGTKQTLSVTAGTTATYTFDAPAGRLIYLDSLDGQGDNLFVSVKDPNGNILFNTNDTNDSGPWLLEASGTYTLTLAGNTSQAAGSYTFRVLDLSAATAVASGDDVSGTVGEAFGTQAYRIDSVAGLRLYYDGQETDFSNVGVWLYGPSGNVIASYNADDQSQFGPLEQNGPYVLLIRNNTATSATYHFRLLDPGAAPTLSLDTDVSGTFPTGRSSVAYQFKGTAGETVYYDALLGEFPNVSVTLVGPGDVTLFQANRDDNSGPTVLPEDGTYRLVFRSRTEAAVTYAFNLRSLTSPTPLALGETASADLGASGRATVVYKISATAGQTLLFDGLDGVMNLASFRLIDPVGRTVAALNSTDDFYPINVGATGDYTLLIAGGTTSAATVHFRLLDASAGTAITAGSTVHVTLPTGREVAVYRLSATAGHNYYYNGLVAGGATGRAEIYDPNFNLVTSRSLEDDVQFGAALTGTYYVVIRGERDAAIDHSFRILDLADASALAVGATTSGALPTGREFVAFSFQGTAGQTIYYDGLGTTPRNQEIRILGPSGNAVRASQADGDLGPITLMETGTYTFLIAGFDTSASSYQFRVLDVAPTPALPLDTPISGTLAGGGAAIYRISADAAEALRLHATTRPANVDWFLYDPSNNQITSSGINGDLSVTTQRTGTYVLVLSYRGEDPVSYTIEASLTPNAPVTTSGLGVDGTLEVPIGGSQSVDFTAPAGTRLLLDCVVNEFTIPVQTIHLDAGQTYQLREDAGGDMTGTLVTSDKPVAVYGGNLAAFVPDGYAAANHLVEQLPPTDSWGREFLTYPLATRLHGDVFRIVAQLDDTEITINGTVVATIDAGHWYETNLETPSRIQTNHAVLVAQFSHSLEFDNVSADPFMIVVPPYEQFLDHYTVTTPATGFPTNFVNIVAPASAVGSIEVDGVAVAADLFQPIGDSGYVGAQVPIEVGAHDLAGAQPFGVFVYGYAVFDGYGYLGGQSLAPVALVDSIALTPSNLDRQVGSSQTFTARVLDVDGNPLAGVRVDFNSAGSNVASGFAFSDENGNATFTLNGAEAGSDVVVASVGDISTTATIRWLGAVEPPTVVVDSPLDGSSVSAETDLTLTGLATPGAPGVPIVAVTVNGVMADVLDAAGRFFAKVHVKPGSNGFQVVAIDSNGQSAQVNLTVQGEQSAPGSVDFSQFADVTGSFIPTYARTSYNEAAGILYADFAIQNSGQYDANAPLLVGIANISDPSVQVLGASGRTPDGVPYYDFTGLVTGGKLTPSGQTGFLNAQFLNPGHTQFSYSLIFLGKLNEAPTITSLPGVEAIAGKIYAYDVAATDPENDTLTYRVTTGPDGLTIDSAGHLRWAVDSSEIGSHDVTIEVDDGHGGVAQQRFVLEVIAVPPNRPPVFTSVPDVLVRVGSTYQYQIKGTDPDGDPLTFSVESGPTGLAVDDKGLVTWTPTPDQIGQADVVLALSDGRGGRTLQSFQICIRESDDNHAPVIVALPAAFATPGTYASQIKALDSDAGQTLTYHLIEGPSGLTLDPATGALAWSPTASDLGSHPVTIEVSDGLGGTDSATFNLVVNQNTPPTISTTALPEATVGAAYAETITATDPDSGDTLTFSLVNAPPGLAIDPASGRITWNPDANAFANTPLTVQVDDGAGGLTRKAFTLTVRNGQAAAQGNPQFSSVPPTTARAGESLTYAAKAWTPLAATLTYDLASGPSGMVIDPGSGVLAWRPEAGDVGNQTVVVRVRDGLGGVALQSFTIDVTPANTAPVIANGPASPATVGLPWTYKIAAQDAERDPLTVQLVNGPDGMTVAPWSGGDFLAALRWTPAGAGSFPVTIEVDDGQGGVTTLAFDLVVVAAPGENHAPIINSTPPTKVPLGATWTYPVAASDPDGDPLSFSLDDAPDGLTIDPDTGRLTYTPTADALGDHKVTVVVHDGRGDDTRQSFILSVTADKTNGAPSIVSTPPTALVPDGRTFDYALRAIDPDGDPVQWSLDSAPHGVSIDPAFGTLIWTPDESELGPQTIVVRVTDPAGASGTQTIRLVVECADSPPSIVSTPVTDAGTKTPYFYGVRAIDPENEKLTYALDLAPDGMTIDPDTGLIRWTPTADQVGAQEVRVKVTDGFGGEALQSFTAQVVAVTPDRAPVVTSIPPLRAPVDAAYTYQVRAVDPEGQAVTFSLISPPEGMTIDAATGLIRWTPTTDQAGAPTITVAADDPGGHRAYQRYTLLVRTNAPPVITEAPASAKTAAAGGVYRYDVRARDPEGDALTYALQDAPDGMTIDGLGRIRWTTAPGDAGSHSFTVVVTDAQGASSTQAVTLSLVPDTKAPTVKIVSGANPASIDTPVVVVVQATDDIGLANVSLTVDDQRVALNADGQATLSFPSGGVHNLVATGTDAAGNVGTATLTLRVVDPADTDGPLVSVESPAPGSSVTKPTPIVGTVSSPDLERYRVEYALASDVDVNDPTAENPAYHLITEKIGSASVNDATLATFDPSMLLSDRYVIRVLAFDTNGNATGQIVPVDVTGQRSLGQYQITVTDLALSVAGIPITVSRTYDTRQADTSGDFGFGWSLAVQDARISESVPVNPLEVEGLFFAATPFRDGTRVYINAPNGRREGFTFEGVAQFSWFGGAYYLPSFKPDAGVKDTLSVDATALTRTPDGSYALQFLGFPYNPSVYRLTTPDGSVYQYNQFTGLESVTNRAGNTLTYTEDGITSSTGVSVKFDRDPQGRIVKIEAPGGITLTYEYDADGNLIAANDPTGRPTTYGYLEDPAHPHFLTAITDAAGNSSTAQFDSEGRLIGLADASGNTTTNSYDAEGGSQTIVDALGNQTILSFDDRGNVTKTTDALGHTRTFTFDDSDNLMSVTDPSGNTVHMTYDAAGNVTSTTDALGNVSKITYDAHNNITSVTDALGRTATTLYDDLGRTKGLINALGQTSSFTRDDQGRIISFTDNLGQVTHYEYDGTNSQPTKTIYPDGSVAFASYNAQGLITRSVDTAGNAWTYTYDDAGRPLTKTDSLGGKTTYEYDAVGQLISVTDATGAVTRYTYDDAGRRTSIIDPSGDAVSYVYDANNRVVEELCCGESSTKYVYRPDGKLDHVTDPLGGVTSYTYDATGNILTITDPLGHVTSYTYDAMGRELTETDALGETTSYEYDAAGNLVKATDPTGKTVTYAYDGLDRLTTTTDQAGQTLTTTYDAGGNTISLTDPDGNQQHFTYDALGRMTTSTDALGKTTSYTYDTAGNLSTITDPLGQVTHRTYDALGRMTSQTDPEGRTTSYGYDADNRTTSITNPDGTVTRMTYDSRGNVLSVTDPTGATTQYEYDDEGRQIATIDALGNRTEFEYDCLGRLVKRTDPSGASMTYEYDAAGNLTKYTDRDGRVRTYTYDAVNRPVTESWQQEAGTPVIDTFHYTYDSVGRVIAASDAFSSYTMTYDALGDLATIDNDGTPGVPHVVLTYERNAFGDVTSVKDNLGLTVSNTYDDIGQLTSTQWQGGGVASARADLTYDANGQMTSIKRFSDLAGTNLVGSTTSTYTAAGLLDTLTVRDGNDNSLVTYDYAYDDRGSLTAETHHGQSWSYTYDDSGQLTSATLAGNPALSTDYSYDDQGNRTSEGETVGTANQITSDATYRYTYDAEGNLSHRTRISDGATTDYQYDLRNRLVSVTDRNSSGAVTQTVNYTYDVFDRRIGKTVNGQTSYTVYDGQAPWADFDASGNVTARYLVGPDIDSLLARDRPGEGTTWYLADRLGTVRDLADANGQIIDHIDYDAYGQVTGETNPSVGDRFRYTGREYDAETDLYYFRARYYDAALGRFISQDPIGFDGADSNLYRYVGNEPTNATDPTGLQALAEYTALLPEVLMIVNTAVTYGGDEPMTFAVGVQGGQPFMDVAGSPNIKYKFSFEDAYFEGGPGAPPKVGVSINGFGASYKAGDKGFGFSYGNDYWSGTINTEGNRAKSVDFQAFPNIPTSPTFSIPGNPPLGNPAIPGAGQFDFLVVSTAKSPNAVASWDAAVYGAVATELALIAKYAVTDDSSTLVEVDFHKQLDYPVAEWTSHGFATRTPTPPFSGPLGSGNPPPTGPTTSNPSSSGPGGPPDPYGPPDDGDNGGGGGGGGGGPNTSCNSALGLYGIRTIMTRSYLGTPALTQTTIASRDAGVLRFLNRVIGPR